MATLIGNTFIHAGYAKSFDIGTNRVSRFQIGEENGVETWLKGDFVGDDRSQPLFNGLLYLPAAVGRGVIIDNFPVADSPPGWTKRIRMDGNGYELVADDEVVLFGYREEGDVVHVTTNLYGSGGQLIASTRDGSFIVTGSSLRM